MKSSLPILAIRRENQLVLNESWEMMRLKNILRWSRWLCFIDRRNDDDVDVTADKTRYYLIVRTPMVTVDLIMAYARTAGAAWELSETKVSARLYAP